MDVFQYIICFIIILTLPPVTWIYALIYCVLNGCRIKKFFLADVAICEFDSDDTNYEELVILKQMLDDFRVSYH